MRLRLRVAAPVRPFRGAARAAVLLLISWAALPGQAGAAKFAGAFMEDGGGARALALGGAFVAVADDPSTVFWNAAGLAGTPARQALLMHEERFGGLVDRDFAAYVQPVDWALLGGERGGFGVGLIRLGVDDIPFTAHLAESLDTNGDGVVSREETFGLFNLQDQIRFESDQELALIVAYGEQRGAWRLGGALKVVRQSVGDYSSLGLGFDLALLRPRVWRGLDVGLKIQDATTTYLSWSTGENEVIVPAVIPGAAYRWALPRWEATVLLAASLETRVEDRGAADQFDAGDVSANAHLGLEVGFRDRVFLRSGFDSGFGAEHFTAGAGFRLLPLTVDYAYAGDTLDIDEVTHRISLSTRF